MLEAKSEMGSKLNGISKEGRDAMNKDAIVERPQSGKPPTKTDFDPNKHLDSDERDMCQRNAERLRIPVAQAYKQYWANLDNPAKPGLRKARLEAGRPIKQSQI